MPDNKKEVINRAYWLEKLRRNNQFHNDYTTFMNVIIIKGYATRVPADQAGTKKGTVTFLNTGNTIQRNLIMIIATGSRSRRGVPWVRYGQRSEEKLRHGWLLAFRRKGRNGHETYLWSANYVYTLSFQPHKFVSNRRKVMGTVLMEDRAKQVRSLALSYDKLPMEQVLGVECTVDSDITGLPCDPQFPLGMTAPYLLIGKKTLPDLGRRDRRLVPFAIQEMENSTAELAEFHI